MAPDVEKADIRPKTPLDPNVKVAQESWPKLKGCTTVADKGYDTSAQLLAKGIVTSMMFFSDSGDGSAQECKPRCRERTFAHWRDSGSLTMPRRGVLPAALEFARASEDNL